MSSNKAPVKSQDISPKATLIIGKNNRNELENLQNYKSLTELDVSSNSISAEITGIKALKLLKKLNISSNQVRFCFEFPTSLESLYMHSNILTRIDPALLTLQKLVYLDLSHNFISDVAGLERLVELKHLFLKSNQISDISCLMKLGKLVELDCEANAIYCSRSTKLWEGHRSINILSLRGNPVLSLLQSNIKDFLPNLVFKEEGIFAKDEKAYKESQIYQINKIKEPNKLLEQNNCTKENQGEPSTNEPLHFSDFDDQFTEEGDQTSESLTGFTQRSANQNEKACPSPVFAGNDQAKFLSSKRENSMGKPKINEAMDDHSFGNEKREKKVFQKKMDFGKAIGERDESEEGGLKVEDILKELRIENGKEQKALEKLRLPQNEISRQEQANAEQLKIMKKETTDLKKQLSLEIESHKVIMNVLTLGFWSIAELVGRTEENLNLFDFQGLRRLLEEKLDSEKKERGDRVLKKFDELNLHYRLKEENLLMKVNDLESALAITVPKYVNEMKSKLEKETKAQYEKLLGKYIELRKSMENSLNETLKQESDGLGSLEVTKVMGLRNENRILKKNLLDVSSEYEKLFKRKSSYLDSLQNGYLSKIRELQSENQRLVRLQETAKNHHRMNSVNISRIQQDSFSMDAGRSHYAACSQMEDVGALLGDSEQRATSPDKNAIKMLNLIIKNLRYKVRKLEEKLAESKENQCSCKVREDKTKLSIIKRRNNRHFAERGGMDSMEDL